MRLKPLDLSTWIERDENWEAQLQLKAEIISKHRGLVLQALPGSEEACFELRDLIWDFMSSHFPEIPAEPPSRNAEEALLQISRWTQEDWALLSAEAPVRLVAGLVCFPSRWSLAEKIGLGSDGIHAPVPKFSSIAKPTQSFMEKMSVDKPMERLNWTIHDTDELFVPKPHPPTPGLTTENILQKTFLRIERQTLRRLPKSRLLAFSIRTYTHRLDEVVSDPTEKERLRKSLSLLSPDSAAYKGMRHFHELLKAAL